MDTKFLEFSASGKLIKLPPEFVRRAGADEIRIWDVVDIEPNAGETPARKPSNSRARKLVVDIHWSEFTGLDFRRVVRDVQAMCPALECFEVIFSNRFSVSHSRTVREFLH